MRLVLFSGLSLVVLAGGCGMFQSRREQEIKEKLQKIQEELDNRADSIRKERYKMLQDSSNIKFEREIDSIKRNSDSLEKEIKKNIEDLKKKNKEK
jgi:hypothetical protein